MRQLCLASTIAALTLALNQSFATEAILVGGGNDVHGSQGQIELNVKWVQQVLADQDVSTSTYFTDGEETGLDVHYQLLPDQVPTANEPLARVFGNWVLHARRYKEHDIPNVVGSTRRDELVPALRERVDATADTDLLLIYNGHGGQSHSSTDQVTLKLWDNTTLSANELHAIVKPRIAPFRYVFTQCYSGGFHRLAYQNPTTGLAVSKAPRCGFTAESAYRLSEGCSASIDSDDYRDYTTYFFAALSGNERDGEIISRNADVNDDGVTTLREAHLFTIEEAYSTDLSRSSSEDYLTQWQPWYLRWLPPPVNLPNNEYAQLFRDLANRYDIPLSRNMARQIRQQLNDTLALIDDTQLQRQSLRQQERELQYSLQSKLSQNWPNLLGPYTGAYQKMAADGELTTISAAITELPGYPALVNVQDQDRGLDNTLLDLERKATQYQKMLRLRQLATLKQQLIEYGSDAQRADYDSLLNCEEVPLHTVTSE